ncbi:MAG: hypothetical protein ACLVFZ_00165 [Parasutterella sp.]
MISLKYANGLRNGANSDTHRCKQLTEHGEERCIKLREELDMLSEHPIS